MSIDSNEIPSLCYAICNNVLLSSLETGQSTPALCDDYVSCEDCVDANADPTTAAAEISYVNSVFASLVQSCTTANNTASSPTFAGSLGTVWISTDLVTVATVISIDGTSETVFSISAITTTIPLKDHYFTLHAILIISSAFPSPTFDEIASSVAAAASKEGITGNATSLVYSALLASPIPTWFASAIPSSYSGEISVVEAQIEYLRPASTESVTSTPASSTTTVPTVSVTPQPAPKNSNAWIAGPVIGCVAGVLVIALAAVLISRRVKKSKGAKERTGVVEPDEESKPQLHSESMALYELGDHQIRPELNGNATPWELAPNEPRFYEMPENNHTDPDMERNEHITAHGTS